MRLGVRKIEGSAQDVADLVVQPRSGRGECRRGQERSAQGLFPASRAEGVCLDSRQSAGEQAHGLTGERRVHGIGAGCPERIDAVRQGVQTGVH